MKMSCYTKGEQLKLRVNTELYHSKDTLNVICLNFITGLPDVQSKVVAQSVLSL